MREIKGFFGEWRPFSNFWESSIEYDGILYKNTEAAFQAQKVCTIEGRRKFSELDPGTAKKLGRSVILRSDWEEVKLQIMYEVVLAKFSQNDELCKLLLSTNENYLEETNNWHDNTWGVCICNKCLSKPKYNLLGKILMKVREELK